MMKYTILFAACLIVAPVWFTATVIHHRQSEMWNRTANFTGAERLSGGGDKSICQNISQPLQIDTKSNISHHNTQLMENEELLGGLLTSGFDKEQCLSRYQSFSYRKTSPYKPSSYLLSKLRNYENLHQRCGPHTKSYNKSVKELKKNNRSKFDTNDCKYVVWISYSGLGNKILTITSAFLYALLTDRILLVDGGNDISDLFCEPFLNSSWLLPKKFPIFNKFNDFNQDSTYCYGNMVRNNVVNESTQSLPWYLYLHLAHDYNEHDKVFFCDQDQTFFEKIPWLIMRTDNYFVPSLFLLSNFEQELIKLFPEKDTLFHHLGRYLFHPSNQVWGLITRYYNAYLSHADEKIGIQIRIFDSGNGPFKYVMDQILACAYTDKLLPEIDTKKSVSFNPTEKPKTKVVLTTSLINSYFEELKTLYWENPTVSGEVISVNQPSHEEFQQFGNTLHNRKALAEMYLLSLSDKLVTSSWSTFGYVAQGLGGLRPWILAKAENRTVPDPPCRRAVSMEPCFHAPPFLDCKSKNWKDIDARVSYVKHCEDVSWGLKLVDSL